MLPGSVAMVQLLHLNSLHSDSTCSFDVGVLWCAEIPMAGRHACGLTAEKSFD